jgi:hypothetical protein
MSETKKVSPFAVALEDLLLFLECSKDAPVKARGVNDVDLRYFRNMNACHLAGYDVEDAHPDMWIFSDVTWDDLQGQFDVCWVQTPHRDDEADDGQESRPKWLQSRARWQINRIRSFPIREARGRWKLVTGKIVEYGHCLLLENGTWLGLRQHYELRKGQWITLPPCKAFQANGNPDFVYAPVLGAHDALYEYEQERQLPIQLGLGYAFLIQYIWRVKFQISDLFSVYLPVLPQNLKSIFADRERSEATGRRAALKHFVQRYWRALPGEKALALQEQVQVIEHLRGREKFNWQGFQGEILPSQDALRALRRAQESMPKPRPRKLKVA